jgi:hypothetical protein
MFYTGRKYRIVFAVLYKDMEIIKQPIYRFIIFALLFLEISILYKNSIPITGIFAGGSLAMLVAGLYRNNNQPHCLIGMSIYIGVGLLLHAIHTLALSHFLWFFLLGAIVPLWLFDGFLGKDAY